MTNERHFDKLKITLLTLTLGLSIYSANTYNNLMTTTDELNTANQVVETQKSEIKTHLQSIQEKEKTINDLTWSNNELMNQVEELESKRAMMTSRGTARMEGGEVFEATAYILGGNTATGFDLTGHTWESARVIAVDPNVIPLGSQVYVEFDGDFAGYSGVYTASDTGGAINGNIIDVFVGHGDYATACQFGRRTVRVKVI